MKKKPESLPLMHRSTLMDVVLTKADGDGMPTFYDMSVSSEAEVSRWFGIEVLDHSSDAVDLSRMKNGAAVLVDHYGDQVGVVRSVRLDGATRKLRASVQFSKNARGQEVERDVADGIRQNVSIGYRVQNMKQVEVRDGDVPVYKVTRWQPLEVSIVAVPADSTVGVNRSGNAGEEFPVELEDGSAVTEERMLRSVKFNDGGAGGGDGKAPDKPTPQPEKPVVDTRDNRKDFIEIIDMCEANGLGQKAAEYIRSGYTPDQVARELLKERSTKSHVQPSVESFAGKKEAKKYSYARAILQAADNESNFDGFEGEVHKELQRLMPAGVKYRGGIMIPMRVANHDGSDEKRTLTSNTLGKGVEVVPDIQGDLIELLRNRAYVLQMGARLLTGLAQPISFPRQIGAITTQWVPENPAGAVAASDPALGLATLIPKTLQATTGYSRQFLNMATVDVEGWIRDELAIVHGLAIDRAAIHGLGSNGEPVGIYNQTGTQTQPFGGTVASYTNLVAMQTAVANLNALAGSLGYLTSPAVAGKLKSFLDFSASAAGRPIWDGPFDGGTIGGYKAFATNQVSTLMTGNAATGGTELGVVFGNWMDFIVGLFAAMEIIVDPYAQKKLGLIEVTSFQMCDLLIRHPESFCKSNGAT